MKNLLIMATEYKAMKAKEQALKNEMETLKADIITAMDGQKKVIVGQYTITNEIIVSHVLNTKRIKEERPDIAETFTEEKEAPRFTVR